MAKGLTFDNDLLKLIFQALPIANIADNAASAALTNLYVALHSADPGAGGNQTTSEVVYTGYARMNVVRSTAGWTVNSNSVSPVSAISFASCPSGTGTTASFFSIGVTGPTGASKILYTGAVSPPIPTGAGVTPILTTGSTITES